MLSIDGFFRCLIWRENEHFHVEPVAFAQVVDLTQRQEVRCPRPQAPGPQAPGPQAPGSQAPGSQAPGPQTPGPQTPGQSSGKSLLAKALARSLGETAPKNPSPVKGKAGSAFMKEVVMEAIHGNHVSNMMENEL